MIFAQHLRQAKLYGVPMDISTVIGIVGAFGLVFVAILMGGGLAWFISIHFRDDRGWGNHRGDTDQLSPERYPGNIQCYT